MLGQCCLPNHNTPPTSSRGAGAAATQKNSPTVSPRRVRGNGNTKQTKEGEKNDTDWEGEDEDYASHGPPSPPNLTPSSLMPRRAARSVKNQWRGKIIRITSGRDARTGDAASAARIPARTRTTYPTCPQAHRIRRRVR
ncbi:hypothetical protein B0H10DRAFT_1960107 [Mycena sp. CBHHK59/15]|nr:hypothetical protein B0H10DRAFT_1960107 [Mycena sp. CBHHK59/15]